MKCRAALGILVLLVALWSPSPAAQSGGQKWVGTWTTAAVGRPQTPPPAAPALPPFMANQCPAAPAPVVAPPPGQTFAPLPFAHFTNQTLRQIVRTSTGGSRVAVVLSNAHSAAPLVIGAASIALRERDSAIQSASIRLLAFSGRPTIAIPPRAVVYSDSVDLNVAAMSDLAVATCTCLYGTDTASPTTMHNASFQTNYISETGNHVGKVTLPTAGDHTKLVLFVACRGSRTGSDAGSGGIRRLHHGRHAIDS